MVVNRILVFVAFLILGIYVAFMHIREHVKLEENHVVCNDGSCVRFCCHSSDSRCMYNISEIIEAEYLPQNFTIIHGDTCEQGGEFSDKWKFNEVK